MCQGGGGAFIIILFSFMFFTFRDFTEYILHLQPSLTWQQAEEKAKRFESWMAKKRPGDLKQVKTPDLPPKTTLKWKGMTPKEIIERQGIKPPSQNTH